MFKHPERIGVFFIPKPMGPVEAVRYAAEIGLGAFEPLASLTTPEPDPQTARLVREEADRLGIALPSLSVGITLTDADAPQAIARLKGCADAARTMGIPYLHHTIRLDFNPDNATEPYEAVLERALPAVREVFDYAADLGVRCVYEDQGMYFNGVKGFGDFFDALDRPAGVVLDLGNTAFVNEKPADFARRFAKDIVHVHVKDYHRIPYSPDKKGYRLGDEMLTAAILGEGDCGVADALAVLNDIGYEGWFMLENEPVKGGVEEQKECAAILRGMMAKF